MGYNTIKNEKQNHRAAFQVWYECNRDFLVACKKLKASGAKVSTDSMYNWASSFNWRARADELDREAEKIALKAAVHRRAEMLKRHAEIGRAVQGNALKWLKKIAGKDEEGIEKLFDNGAQAVSAIRTGVELERKSEGLPDHLLAIASMTDDELVQYWRSQLTNQGGFSSGNESAGHNAAAAGEPGTSRDPADLF